MFEERGPSILAKATVDGSVRYAVFVYKQLKIYHVEEVLQSFSSLRPMIENYKKELSDGHSSPRMSSLALQELGHGLRRHWFGIMYKTLWHQMSDGTGGTLKFIQPQALRFHPRQKVHLDRSVLVERMGDYPSCREHSPSVPSGAGSGPFHRYPMLFGYLRK